MSTRLQFPATPFMYDIGLCWLAVGCCCRLLILADGQSKRMHNGGVTPASDAVMVGTSLKSVWNSFFVTERLSVCALEISIRELG